MATPSIDIDALGRAGMAALSRGDAAGARRLFEQIVAAGAADAPVWVAVAVACQGTGDGPAASNALDRALALDPRNLRALLMKGDVLAAGGERRGAISFYKAALDLVPDLTRVPPEAAQELRRAAAACERLNAEIYADLDAHLSRSGYDPKAASPRFAESLELLTGRKARYEQRPRSYFFPGLPTIQFFPRETFPWIPALEAATDDIAAELAELMKDPGVFAPYIEAEEDRPVDPGHNLLDNADWSACYLWRDGEIVPEIAERCPKTMAVLAEIPMEQVRGRAPFALFSKLAPGAWIKPHTGFLNTRLVCHLPLIVPPGCRFRVGNDVREWKRGEAWVFDDTIEHEARNDGAETRVVLIFNVWRPELSDEERRLVAALMEGVDRL